MFTKRLLYKVAPIAITLFVFLFGTQSVIADTYRWQSAADGNWSTAANWYNETTTATATTAPGSGDAVKFTTGTLGKVSVDANVTVSSLLISVDQMFDLTNLLTIGTLTLDSGADMVIDATVNAGTFTVTSGAILSTSSSISKIGTRSVNLALNGTLAMGTLDAATFIGSGIYTTIGTGNASFITTDVVFMGTLDINDQDIPLGTNNIYFGPNPGGQLTGYSTDVSSKQATGSFITLNENYTSATTVVGRVCKGYGPGTTGLDSYFTFPLKVPSATITHLVLGVLTTCTTSPTFSSAIPFPNIAARVVYNPGGASGGHPGADPNNPTVLFHWPIVGNGIAAGAGLAGYTAFHNQYRNNGTALFSAIYKPNLEYQTPPTNNPLFEGAWELIGSQPTPTTGGNFRWVPFGPYNGLNYGSTSVYASYTGACMTGFGDIGVGTSGGIIPVELVSFSARYMDRSVRLNWQTATELNNNGFYIERSIDGEGHMWEEIDFISGAGNSNAPIDYRYEDALSSDLARLPKIAYRLRQVDRDGSTDYSSIVYAYTDAQPFSVELYKAYPNPFNPSTTLSYSLKEASHVTLKVYNTYGQEVATVVNNSVDAGYHTVEFRGSELPSGVYIAVLETSGNVQQQKLVLNK